MAQVEMIIGERGPRSERLDSMRASADAKAAAPANIEARGTAYASAFRRFRIQITSPSDRLDPATGRIEHGRPLVAAFQDWHYVNDAKDPAVRRLIDDVLTAHPRFGLNLDFWKVSDQKEAVQAKRIEDARDTLRRLPKEVVMDFLASLAPGVEADHVLKSKESK